MAQQSIVVVTGATGQQGGGLVDALLNQGKFKVRAITRDTLSAKAEALAKRGVEVVAGNFDDKASLVEAFQGAHGVFLMTNVVADLVGGAGANAEMEIAHGKNGIDAAKEAGVKHLVWSGLEDVRKLPGVSDKLKEVSPGRLMPHFESKGEVTEYLRSSGVPATVVLTSGFFSNFLSFYPFIPQDDGTYAFYMNIDRDQYAAHDGADIGATAAAVLVEPDKYIGKTVPVVSQLLAFSEAADVISKVTGKTLKLVEISDEAAASAGHPDLRPLGDAIVKGKSFEQWAQEHRKDLAAQFK